jgi:hypothetical protein
VLYREVEDSENLAFLMANSDTKSSSKLRFVCLKFAVFFPSVIWIFNHTVCFLNLKIINQGLDSDLAMFCGSGSVNGADPV